MDKEMNITAMMIGGPYDRRRITVPKEKPYIDIPEQLDRSLDSPVARFQVHRYQRMSFVDSDRELVFVFVHSDMMKGGILRHLLEAYRSHNG
ncbi:MAG: hypothetical protein GY896_22780 [Gammaproteobacteria bacterium]|nr:hypothetical protein [Gammaproteobacteria bacterium]